MSDAKPWEPDASVGIERLYRKHSAWLVRQLRFRFGADEAADIVQETYLKVARYQQRGVESPRTLLLTIALNLARDQSRKRATHQRVATTLGSASSEAAVQIDTLALKQIVLTMPPLYRDVFLLNRVNGLGYSEIAKLKGISVATVERRMSKALNHCLSQLAD